MPWHELDDYRPHPLSIDSSCWLCKASRRTIGGRNERILSTGITIDFEGGVDICESCIGEAAHMLGWISPARADELAQDNARLAGENQAMSARVQEADAFIEAVRKVATNDKRYVCDFPGCDADFEFPVALSGHKRTHKEKAA